MTAAEIAQRLGGRPQRRGFMARCPAHDDRRPSLSIAEGADGKVLLYCFAGCKLSDILRAAGLSIRDLFPSTKPSDKRGEYV